MIFLTPFLSAFCSFDNPVLRLVQDLSDPNVLLRLRAWRPRMEVLLPWDLRQQMAAEVEQERRLYWEWNGGKG